MSLNSLRRSCIDALSLLVITIVCSFEALHHVRIAMHKLDWEQMEFRLEVCQIDRRRFPSRFPFFSHRLMRRLMRSDEFCLEHDYEKKLTEFINEFIWEQFII